MPFTNEGLVINVGPNDLRLDWGCAIMLLVNSDMMKQKNG